MRKTLVAGAVSVAALLGVPTGAMAQWMPGAEIVGQSVQVETNGVVNVVHFDAGGGARIVSPNGMVVPGTWSAANGQLCLTAGGGQECWPYTQAFQAGQAMQLTSSCQSSSTWLAQNTNVPPPPPPPMGQGERG